MSVLIRPAREDEATKLLEIQRVAFLPLYEKYRDDNNPALRGIEDVLDKIRSETHRYFTIFFNGEIVGGVVYKCPGAAVFDRQLQKGEYYLNRIYIKPELQGRKIAQSAILLCEKEFDGGKTFFVDFPEDLEKNKACYSKAGYTDTGRRIAIKNGLTLAFYKKTLL